MSILAQDRDCESGNRHKGRGYRGDVAKEHRSGEKFDQAREAGVKSRRTVKSYSMRKVQGEGQQSRNEGESLPPGSYYRKVPCEGKTNSQVSFMLANR